MKTLNTLCSEQGWGNQDISDILPSRPSVGTIYKWRLDTHSTCITDNDLMLLNYVSIYGELKYGPQDRIDYAASDNN